MKNLVLALALIATQQLFAASAEVWEGPGALIDLNGKTTSTYNVVVENTNDAGQIKTDVTVTLADGSVQKQQCVGQETGAESWTAKCDGGEGAGRCFSDGICISYEAYANGRAIATTIAKDGPADMRVFHTELQNGKAVQFLQEKLHKR